MLSITVLVYVVATVQLIGAQQAPPGGGRDKRTIGTLLTNVGNVFGYDVFQRPRIVLNIPATIPVPAPAPAPAPAAMPAAGGGAKAKPAAGGGAAPPAAALTAPTLLTDSVRRQFSINLNWNRNKSPDPPQPVVAAYVAPAVPLAPVPPPPPAPIAPPPASAGPQRLPPPDNKITLVDYDEEVSEEYEDRPKRFHIELADDDTNVEVTQVRRSDDERRDSRDKFKRGFNEYWEESPYTAQHGYKYVVPEATLVNGNVASEVPAERSRRQDSSVAPKVRTLKVTHNIRIHQKPPVEDFIAAPATPVTYYEPPPKYVDQSAKPSGSTEAPPQPFPVNPIILKFYKKKFAVDAAVAQRDADVAKAVVNSYPPDKVLPMQYEAPLDYYSNPDVYPPLEAYVQYENVENAAQNEDKKENEDDGKQDVPERTIPVPYAPGERSTLTEPIEKESPPGHIVVDLEKGYPGEKIVLLDDYIEYNNDNDPEKLDIKAPFHDFSYDGFGKYQNLQETTPNRPEKEEEKSEEVQQQKQQYQEEEEEEVQQQQQEEEEREEQEEEGDGAKNSKIVENHPNEFLQVENLKDARESDEEAEKSVEKEDVKAEEEEEDSKPYVASPEDVDNFIKQHFSDQKFRDFNQIRDEISSERDYIHDNNNREEESEEEEPQKQQEAEGDEEDHEAQKQQEAEEDEEDHEAQKQSDEDDDERQNQEEEEEETQIIPTEEISEKEKDSREAEESAKIVALEKEHEKNFYNVFPNLGTKARFGNFDQRPKSKTETSETKYVPSKKNLVQPTHAKQSFKDKDNFEAVEKTVVHPLYSGVWHIGNLQELYKAEKPVTVPFDHEYSASEKLESKSGAASRVRRDTSSDADELFMKEIAQYEKEHEKAVASVRQVEHEAASTEDNDEGRVFQENTGEYEEEQEKTEASERKEKENEDDGERDEVESTKVRTEDNDGGRMFREEVEQYEVESRDDPYALQTTKAILELSQATEKLENYQKPEETKVHPKNIHQRVRRDTRKDPEELFHEEIAQYEKEREIALNGGRKKAEASERYEVEDYENENGGEASSQVQKEDKDGGRMFQDEIEQYEEESRNDPYARLTAKTIHELSQATEKLENYQKPNNQSSKERTKRDTLTVLQILHRIRRDTKKDAEQLFQEELAQYEKERDIALNGEKKKAEASETQEEKVQEEEEYENENDEALNGKQTEEKSQEEEQEPYENHQNEDEGEKNKEASTNVQKEDKDGGKMFQEEIEQYEEESRNDPYARETAKAIQELAQATENLEYQKLEKSKDSTRTRRDARPAQRIRNYEAYPDLDEAPAELKSYEETSEYVPDSYNSKFTYVVPEPKVPDMPDYSKLQIRHADVDSKLSPNAFVTSKISGRKKAFVTVTRPFTVVT